MLEKLRILKMIVEEKLEQKITEVGSFLGNVANQLSSKTGADVKMLQELNLMNL